MVLNTMSLWLKATWASLTTQRLLMQGTMEFNQRLIGKRRGSSRRKICNYRLRLGKERPIIKLMFYLQTKLNLIKVICRKDSKRKIRKRNYLLQLEELTVTNQPRILIKIWSPCKLIKGRTLTLERCKETWMLTFKIFKKFRWRIRDNKISFKINSVPWVEMVCQTLLLVGETWTQSAWCLPVWCNLKMLTTPCEEWILMEAQIHSPVDRTKLTVT